MSGDVSKARSRLNSVNLLLKQDKLISAVMALEEGVGIYLRTKLLKHEIQDLQRKIESATSALALNQQFKEQYPLVLEYTPGHEKTLQKTLREIVDELQESVTSGAQEHLKLLEQRKEAALTAAQEHLDRSDFDKADAVFQNLLKEFREDADLKIDIADRYLEKDLFDEALKYLKRAHDDDPDSIHVLNKLGVALRKAGRYELAERVFLEALRKSSTDEVLFFNLGRVYIDWQKWDKAIKASDQALSFRSPFPEAEKMRQFAQKKHDPARN
jgi:tetratricopeptide (TPR) repeat protein